jgi:hypothetical protein
MTGYSKALCSILGTLMVLALIASPGLAQGKKKKKGAEEPAPSAEAEAEGSGSLDSLMESAAEKKKEAKKKKGKKGEEEAPAEEKVEAPAEEEVAEPDSWERPPVEEKAPSKEAPPPVEDDKIELPISVGLLLGYGFTTDRKDFGADPYGLLAGVRGGYTFDFALYVGLYFNYYLGGSQTGGDAIVASDPNRESSASYMQFGAEVGYDVYAGPVILRPSLGIGVAIGFTDATGETLSVGDMMFGPGVTVLYPIDEFFLGGDLRGNLVTGDGISAVTVAATGGMRF